MAEKTKQYFRDIQPGDVSIEGRQANGMTADSAGNVFIYSGLNNTELQTLDQQNFNGNVAINGNINSFLGIIKNKPQETLTLGNNNYEIYNDQITTDPNKITTATTNTVNCADEFNDASKILLNWENDNQKFGWGPYGLSNQKLTAADDDGNGTVDFQEAQNYFLDNYWNTNNNNKDLTTYGNTNINNSKLTISNLPPGLRIAAAQLNYSAGAWWTRILVALGPDFANAKDSNGKQLGIPYKKSTNIYNDAFDYVRDKNTGVNTSEKIYNPTKNPPVGSETILWHTDRIQLFIDQYDEIIKYYNANKGTFLENLYQESLRYYRGVTAVKTGNKTNPTSESLYKDFYTEYAKKARDLALKYKDCPFTISQTTTVSPTQAVVNQLPTKETTPPEPAPDAESGFIFLDETEFEIEPTQLTGDVQYIVIVPIIDVSPDGTVKQSEGSTTKVVYKNIKDIPLLKDKAFRAKVTSIATEFGIKADSLLKIMINESGLNPAAALYRKCLNPNCLGAVLYSNTPKAGYTLFAGGLIGFIRPYAPSVCDGNSIDAVITKDALTQLDYVRNFLSPLKSTLRGADDALLYMHFAIPALVSKMKKGDNSTLLAFGKVSAQTISAQNPGLATTIGKKPGDPLTIGDFRKFVNKKFGYQIPSP